LRLREERTAQDAIAGGSLGDIVRRLPSGVTIGALFEAVNIEHLEAIMGDQYVTGQVGAVGPQSVAIGQHFLQVWMQTASEIDLPSLLSELQRTARSSGTCAPEEDVALAELAKQNSQPLRATGPKLWII
jgi:hypothetical protein